MSDFIHKLFTSYKERTDGDTRIGELYRIWYDSITNTLRIQLDDTPGGTIIGGGSGGGDYTLPTASTTVKGGVKIDGTTITINNQVISGFSGSYTDLTNKPTIPAAQVNSDWTASSGVAQILNKPTLFSGSYTDLTNKPTIPDAYTLPTATDSILGGVKIGSNISIDAGVISVAAPFSGSYTDLTNKPTIPAAQIQSDWTQTNNASLDYIKNKPTIPTTVTVNGTAITLGSSGTVTAAADTLTGSTLASGVTASSLTSVGTLTGLTVNSTSSTPVSITSTGRPGSETNTWSFVSNQGIGGPSAWIQFPDGTLQTTAAVAQIQSDWTQSDNTSLDYIKNKPTIPDITNIEDTLAATGEPMGHEDKDQSTISFDSTSRTFTITPVAANFEVWVRGTKHTYTTAQTVTLPNTSGIYYIYFDSNGLGAQTDFFIWDEQAPTALVYYNAVTGLAPYFADERHGTTLDWQTHEYLHRTRGAVIANGFSVGSYTIGGEVQLDIANGTFFDEDLEIDVTHSNTPTANTWEQDLQGPAQIPMFYLSGTGWVRDNPTGYLNKQGTSRPRYNSLSGGVWSVADIDNNKYGTTFVVATNNLTYPIIGIMSQSSHASQGDAEGLEFSDLVLTGFPVAEFRLLYKVVFKADSTHGHLTSVWDLRQLSATTPSAAIGSDHGLLSGLGDDDHPQYLLRTEAPSVPTLVSAFTNDSGYLTSVSWDQVSDKPQNILTLNDTNVVSNDMLVNDSITIGSTSVALGQSITSLTGLTGVTSNAATAFIAGDAAISGVALQMPSEAALRNLTNGATNMYFDVSIGGSTQGQFQFRSSSSYTNILTMSSTGVSFNTDATFTSRTPSLARTAFNSAIDTEITVDNMRFRISNQGGIFPQVIGNGSSRNLAWTGVGAISGSAVAQAGSTGTIVSSSAWISLYTLHGMDSAGDTVTVTLQDKALSRIYRITFMRSDNGSTTGYNIIAERLL